MSGEEFLLKGWCELALILSCIFCVWFIYQRLRRMSILERHGIPGPRPNLIYGNLLEYRKTENVLWDSKLIKRYGPICGYYLGAKPVILVSELSLIDKIQGRDCLNFLNRPRRVPGGINPDPKRAKMLGNLNIEEWKHVRHILDKGFSNAMLTKMNGKVTHLIHNLRPHLTPFHEEVVNFYELFQDFTLDLIGTTAFGYDSDIINNPDDLLKGAVEQEFSKKTGVIADIYLCLPEFQPLLQWFRVQWEKIKNFLGYGANSSLWERASIIAEQRKRSQEQSQACDLMSVMMQSGKMDDEKIIANTVLFFEAGFETLSASLGFITYLLMKNMDVQETLRKEIQEIFRNHTVSKLTLDVLKQFKFLDAVINEALRMYPPQTTFITRSGAVDLIHEYEWKGQTHRCVIPKNVQVQVCLYQVHNSEETWKSPRTFNPYRFFNNEAMESGQKNVAFQPFGRGRRICIGRKYADMVLKMVLIEVLLHYKLEATERQMKKMEKNGDIRVVYKTATMTPKNGVIGRAEMDPLVLT